MTDRRSRREAPGIRRPPPPFRTLSVVDVAPITPYMTRVTLEGEELGGLVIDRPAASVRLLLPSPGANELVIPDWNGNEFLLPGGSRPIIRTFTPLDLDATALRISLAIVLHDTGMTSAWVTAAEPGDPVAISGPARGHRVDDDAAAYILVGDETALPAVGQLIDAMPVGVPVSVIVEVGHPAARLDLPRRHALTTEWVIRSGDLPHGHALVDAVRTAEIPDGAHVWAAGEAAAMQQIRRHLKDERGIDQARVTVRGYWKHGR